MAAAHFNNFYKKLENQLKEENQFNRYLALVEQKTGAPRVYIVLGVLGLLSMYLIFGYFAQLLCNVIGFLYPAYMSVKAIESADKNDDTQWLTYWVVFGLFSVTEFGIDAIISWFPFYWLVKCAFLLYLHLPAFKGAEVLYVRYVRPFVLKHQTIIDRELSKVVNKVGDGIKNNVAENLKSK